MPTLFRLLLVLAVIAGVIYAAMAALIAFVEPSRTEITVEVPLEGITPEQGPRRLDPGVPD